jgi:hypothetical protein
MRESSRIRHFFAYKEWNLGSSENGVILFAQVAIQHIGRGLAWVDQNEAVDGEVFCL